VTGCRRFRWERLTRQGRGEGQGWVLDCYPRTMLESRVRWEEGLVARAYDSGGREVDASAISIVSIASPFACVHLCGISPSPLITAPPASWQGSRLFNLLVRLRVGGFVLCPVVVRGTVIRGDGRRDPDTAVLVVMSGRTCASLEWRSTLLTSKSVPLRPV